MLKISSLFLLLFFSLSTFSLSFTSGKEKVHLIELYTSQSCSSCPPAEAWISQFKDSKDLWKKVIPISFHVSYWNYLSWKDPYSKDSYSDRQRLYARKNQTGVFTPQVLLNGKDYQSWRAFQEPSLKGDQIGELNVEFNSNSNSNQALLTFSPLKTYTNLLCFGAYIERGHIDKITSGENRGKTLNQDFVVKDLKQSEVQKLNNQFKCSINFPKINSKQEIIKSVVFWISQKDSWQTLQATGGDI